MESNSVGVQETCGTTPSLFEPPPERGDATVLSTKPKMEDKPTGQDANPIEAATQPASTAASVVELTSSIIPPDQMEEERWYMLVLTALVRSLNIKTTGVILRDMVSVSAGGVASWNPHMVAVLPRPIQERRAISNQGATMKEWGERCRVRMP